MLCGDSVENMTVFGSSNSEFEVEKSLLITDIRMQIFLIGILNVNENIEILVAARCIECF